MLESNLPVILCFRWLGDSLWKYHRLAMVGQRSPGGCLPWQTERGGSGCQKGQRCQWNGYQEPEATQPSKCHHVQVSQILFKWKGRG